MRLFYALHPQLRTTYYFPVRQADLTIPNTRRNPVFTVPGGGGPINPRGNAALDREPNVITYQFQINPYADKRALDNARDDFLRAVDHGIPQTLFFISDDGSVWNADAVLVDDPHHSIASSDVSYTFTASWVLLSDYLQSPATPGTSVYGQYVLYGLHGRYGAGAIKMNLTAISNSVGLDNRPTGATAPTTDPIITLAGPFGTTIPTTYPIEVACLESVTGFRVHLALAAGDVLTVDLGARSVILSQGNVATPKFNVIDKLYPYTQSTYLTILPNTYNTFVVQLDSRGTPNGTLSGQASIQWKPKRAA
jgi:hypothetical protein